jgi:hypothetical protein
MPLQAIQAPGFAVVHGGPVREQLGHAIRAARVEGGVLRLRHLGGSAEQFARAGLVEARAMRQTQRAHGLQQPQRAQAIDVGGVLRLLEADGHVAHGAQVVDLVGLHLLHDAQQAGTVAQVAEVQRKGVIDVGVLVQVVDTLGVEQRRTALDAVHRVAPTQQPFGQVGAVLARDAGDECGLGHGEGGGGQAVHRTRRPPRQGSRRVTVGDGLGMPSGRAGRLHCAEMQAGVSGAPKRLTGRRLGGRWPGRPARESNHARRMNR